MMGIATAPSLTRGLPLLFLAVGRLGAGRLKPVEPRVADAAENTRTERGERLRANDVEMASPLVETLTNAKRLAANEKHARRIRAQHAEMAYQEARLAREVAELAVTESVEGIATVDRNGTGNVFRFDRHSQRPPGKTLPLRFHQHEGHHVKHHGKLAVVLSILAGFAPDGASAQDRNLDAMGAKANALVRAELKDHWYPHAVNNDGGYRQNLARDWTSTPDENRFLVYQARMVWTAAAFAEYSPADREACSEHARKGVAYLDRVMRDREQGGFHWILGPDGKVDPKLGTEKHVYGTSFVLYAASEAYKVTRDPLALKVARDAFDWLERHAHDAERGGYFEALTREGTPIVQYDPGAPLASRVDRLGIYYGFKTMNAHIHLLEALSTFYRVEPTERVRDRLEEMLVVVRDRIAAEPGALNLYLTRDWQATPAHDSFGHDIETAYLLVEASEALGRPEDTATWRVARRLVDHALDWGWDDEHGGFYDKGEAFGNPAFDRTKVWWTQAEGLNALTLLHTKYGRETDRYQKALLKQWAFIERHMIDPEHGGWFMETTREGNLIGDGRKATQWKANYHTSRALMNVATMLGRGGKLRVP